MRVVYESTDNAYIDAISLSSSGALWKHGALLWQRAKIKGWESP